MSLAPDDTLLSAIDRSIGGIRPMRLTAIALTALAMPNDRQRCLNAGMDEYISKPVNLKALTKLIQNILLDKEDKPR